MSLLTARLTRRLAGRSTAALLALLLVAGLGSTAALSAIDTPLLPDECTAPQATTAAPLDRTAVANRLSDLHVVNYYPRAAAQTTMWNAWDPAAIDGDLRSVSGMNGNTVRLALFPDTFGYPRPKLEMQDRLRQVADLAGQRGLRLQLTLFGFWHRWDESASAAFWADCLLSPYHDDPRIAVIEVYNELDTTDARALAWASSLVPRVKQAAGNIPVTVSVSGPDGIAGLSRLREAAVPVDFYALHYYGLPALAYDTFRRARLVAGDVPLFIGEFGYATLPKPGEGRPYLQDDEWLEAYQDQYYRTVIQAAIANGLPAPAPWTLNDFTSGAFPAESRSGADPGEYRYGLLRADGSAKPAAGAVAATFGGSRVDLSFNNGFEAKTTAGNVPNWLMWEAACGTFGREASGRTGTAAVSISATTACPDRHPSWETSPVQPIESGETYSLSAWARGERATGSTRISLAWFDATGQFLSTNSSAPLRNGTSAWTQLGVLAAVPAGAAYVELHLQSSANSGKAWFDDVQFGRVAPVVSGQTS